MRAWTALAPLLLAACSSGAPRTETPTVHAQHTGESFRELSPFVDQRLDEAVAWVVFPDVEDVGDGCSHDGFLFSNGGPPRPARLHCDSGPPHGPAGITYHLVVILDDSRDLERVESQGLDLGVAAYFSPLTDPPPSPGTTDTREVRGPWVVTTSRSGLLYPARALRQHVELTPAQRGAP